MPLGNAPIMAFVATAKPDGALHFYRDTLGLELVEDTPFALVFTGGGTLLRIQKGAPPSPPPYTALGWEVGDIGAMAAILAARGVAFERFPGLEQDERGVWTAPNGQKVAWFKDPDGHILSLAQLKV
ncbi:MAG TPA: VOC family protein [Aliidongia sp.]|nr:VOC family protein [Aliidongia sp.]